MKHKLAKLGSLLLLIALALFWTEQLWFCAGALAAVGVIDLVILAKKRLTISCWYHGRFRKAIDAALMILVLLLTLLVLGPGTALGVLVGTILGHLAASEHDEEE